jgi:hypothetical protein
MAAHTVIEVSAYSVGVLTTCAVLFLLSSALAWRMRIDR